ncbi:LLM class flavin-dependent oxidoreductase [Streptomyces sp. NPDC048277]|uniref:LLM class flavin-dependent oxidoreductase n=1 Tax=Streptomyces sp. NPDC048277 TaxID=3155027 RepID=UPI0033FC904A
MSPFTLGISDQDGFTTPDLGRRRLLLDKAAAAGLAHVCVGDHISFHGGTGFDGLVSASTLLSSHERLSVIVGVYLLGLRHPMTAARQLATLSQSAPGRLTLGVGVGGEDRREVANAGVDPRTRGRRLDESLMLVRRLLAGEEVTHCGEFFQLDRARILPSPEPHIPLVIGGKGEVAVRRAARFGDGWLGIFCSARRFAETRASVLEAAAGFDREPPGWFGVNVWCGLDKDSERARELLAARLEGLYRLPYEKFRHIAPAGTPERIAEFLVPFVEAGAVHLTLIPVAESVEAGIEAVAEVGELLQKHCLNGQTILR